MNDRTSRRGTELPETPSSFTELFDKSLAHTKDAHEKMAALVQGISDAFGEAFSCANKGSAEYGLKVVEIVRAHTNAALDVATDAMAVRSPAELVGLSSDHARKRLELATEQMKDLAALTQRVVNDTTAPIRSHMTEPFRLAS